MKILIAPDKFKGSLTAEEVCLAIEKGLKQQLAQVATTLHPMADGGDGSLKVLANYLNFTTQTVQTVDPLGRAITAQYYTTSKAAFIEVASASGLVLLSAKDRNPLNTSTFGTGIMIADALSKSYREFYLFLGGSATNDAGIGIATALGTTFLDKNKKALQPIGKSLPLIDTITHHANPKLEGVKMTLLCDVTNPFFAKNGAAHVYAAQKGASTEEIAYLDAGLKHFAQLLHRETGVAINNQQGSGAAGGIAGGLMALFGAKIAMGFEVIAKLTGLEEKVKQADWVISGEGKLDVQSLQGKVVNGLAKLCQKHQKSLTLFVGKNDLPQHAEKHLNAKQIHAITQKASSNNDAMSNAAKYLEAMAASSLS